MKGEKRFSPGIVAKKRVNGVVVSVEWAQKKKTN